MTTTTGYPAGRRPSAAEPYTTMGGRYTVRRDRTHGVVFVPTDPNDGPPYRGASWRLVTLADGVAGWKNELRPFTDAAYAAWRSAEARGERQRQAATAERAFVERMTAARRALDRARIKASLTIVWRAPDPALYRAVAEQVAKARRGSRPQPPRGPQGGPGAA